MTPTEMIDGPPEDAISLPDGTVDLAHELVPAIRCLLAKGLPESFIRACVRVGDFRRFPGGMKADLVGGLRVDINAVLKLGGPQLDQHAALMIAVNAARARTFAEVLAVTPLDGQRRLLIMEDLRKHETLFDLVFHRDTPIGDLQKMLDKAVEGLAAIRSIGPAAANLAHVPRNADPFARRLREKLTASLQTDEAGADVLHHPGRVMGLDIPPLDELLEEIARWQAASAPGIIPNLAHGDPHLRNVMIRRRGKGFSVRLIDPNPEIGFTDPAYDFGKLSHFAEPVGWALAAPKGCQSRWTPAASGAPWALDAFTENIPHAAEQRRNAVEQAILGHAANMALAAETTWQPRLHLARAGAHAGLLARMASDTDVHPRRFVLAHALRALARWHSDVKETRR